MRRELLHQQQKQQYDQVLPHIMHNEILLHFFLNFKTHLNRGTSLSRVFF